MVSLTIDEITKALDGQLLCGDPQMLIDNVTTDSRTKDGGLFVALVGENHDAHDYIPQFFDNGGKAVISHKKDVKGSCVILVEDTGRALLKLGGYYRSKFDIPVIGITGSVGKTSTKDMVFGVMNTKFNTLKTPDNKNNEIGMPLTLLSLEKQHKAAVIEMGMSHFGEISSMALQAKPQLGIITNIGTAHIGNLGSQEGILKAKLELIDGIDKDGLLVLNGDDDLLWSMKGKLGIKTVYFGIDNKESDILAYDIQETADSTSFTTEYGQFTIPVVGRYMVLNALAAIVAGRYYDIENELIIKGAEGYQPSKMRQEIETIAGVKIISDCYNASVASMEASLQVMKTVATGRKIAVLGDMLEMGEFSEDCHRQVGRLAVENGADIVICVGENAKYIVEEAKNGGAMAYWFDDNQSAAQHINLSVEKGDTLLFKASRGMKFEDIVELVTQELEKGSESNE
ncbi:MAG: UDP-N-acetylmuramoyl-tripeptide--D-alanyl-D-alanine ligase [Eubacteriales bacterium]|nr:UDP-N-acetylmuramoyl-tripeptide--D-alanyl-D-alanine ligase [Eubacteriales bacterium]